MAAGLSMSWRTGTSLYPVWQRDEPVRRGRDCPECHRTPRTNDEILNHMPTCSRWPYYVER